jgi:hypothetical protein
VGLRSSPPQRPSRRPTLAFGGGPIFEFGGFPTTPTQCFRNRLVCKPTHFFDRFKLERGVRSGPGHRTMWNATNCVNEPPCRRVARPHRPPLVPVRDRGRVLTLPRPESARYPPTFTYCPDSCGLILPTHTSMLGAHAGSGTMASAAKRSRKSKSRCAQRHTPPLPPSTHVAIARPPIMDIFF